MFQYGMLYIMYYHIHRTSLVAQLVKNLPAMWETWVRSLGWEDPLEKGKVTHPLQYSSKENSKDCIVQGISKNGTRLSDFHYHYQIHIVFFSWLLCLA